jgi:hypothetical protein
MPKLILCLLAIPVGVSLFVYGGYDDSPGAQGLGLLLVASGIGGVVKLRKSRGQV